MAMIKGTTKMSSLILGFCLPSLKHNASKIKVPQSDFDSYLKMYFKKFTVLYAHDPKKLCKSGDIVLIQELPKKLSTLITHEVLEVIYPCGDVIDPITGKKVEASSYRDEEDLKDSLFGDTSSRFIYQKAPSRGWQEDKKDFSHRESYVRYHEFDDDDDENKNQPYSTFY